MIYPAHAGINLKEDIWPLAKEHLPRTRGDKPDRWIASPVADESTPHTRG